MCSVNFSGSYQGYQTGQQYPVYPNCFDQLTTHGVIAEDAVGYITDMPSPYLQNYVAQRGWAPSLPGRVLPDPLPTVQPQQPLPKGNMYNTVYPQHPNKHTLAPKDKYSTLKKVALTVLLGGLAVLGIVKGRQVIKNGGLKNIGTTLAKPFKTAGTWIKDHAKSAGEWIKDHWNKLWHKS